MRLYHSIICVLLLTLFALPAFAEQPPAAPENEDVEFYVDTERPRPYNISIAPGYGLLYIYELDEVRQGFGARALLGWEVVPRWQLEVLVDVGVFGGDKDKEEGLYGQVGLLGGFRYTFLDDWVRPYLALHLGWMRTELDREIHTIWVEHSLVAQFATGVVFHLAKHHYLGLEASLAPAFFGDNMNYSMSFHTLLNYEFKF